MADEKKDPASEQRAYLEEWIAADEKQRELRPVVVKMLDAAIWQQDAVQAIHAKSPEMVTELNTELSRNLGQLKRTLPLPTSYDIPVVIATSTSTAGSSNAVVFDVLVSVRAWNPQASPQITAQIDRYHELVGAQGRVDDAGQRAAELFPNLSERFGAVKTAVLVARVNEHLQESAAGDMRTFLYKLKGELFSKARGHKDENMTWPLMAERLSHPSGRQILVEQEIRFDSLINTLSNITKARSTAFDFQETWTRFVDHVYIVCGGVLAGQK